MVGIRAFVGHSFTSDDEQVVDKFLKYFDQLRLSLPDFQWVNARAAEPSELASKGIAVNMVCPGTVMTDAVDAFPDRDARLKKSIDATPSGRLTTPEEVSNVVNFLCGPAAAQIIGQTIVIDGGKTLSS